MKEFGVWVRVYGFLKSVCRHRLAELPLPLPLLHPGV
jgi:hypothetical protein